MVHAVLRPKQSQEAGRCARDHFIHWYHRIVNSYTCGLAQTVGTQDWGQQVKGEPQN